MSLDRQTITSLAHTAALIGFGFVGTVAIVLGLLYATRGLQPPIYHALYLTLGPTDATQAAMVWHFTLAVGIAALLPPLVVAYALDAGPDGVRKLAPVFGAATVLLACFALTVGLRVLPLPIGIAILGIVLLSIPILLHYRYDVHSPALPTLGGAVPVIVVVFLLLGFGMGWGWGYVVMAETAPPSTVNDATVADFDEAPQVRDDLFTENSCSGLAGGGEQCILSIRGYEHEMQAVRFLARHGVRCPYVNAPPDSKRDAGSFLAEHDGHYYRVTCGTHGD